MQIKDIVRVSVTSETLSSAQQSFGKALILGENISGILDAGEYVKEYTNPADLLTDGLLSTDYEYLMAVQLMAQAKKPRSFLVGVHDTPSAEVMVLTYGGSLTTGTVSLDINRETYSEAYASDENTTMSALAVKIAADPDINTCVWNGTNNTLTITALSGRSISFKSNSMGDFTTIARTYTAQTTTIASDLAAINLQDDSWYALLLASDSRDDVLAAASQVETLEKVFGVDLYDESVLNGSDDDDLGSVFKTNANSRVLWMYKEARDDFYLASWFGRCLPETVGSINWAYKTLSGVATVKLSTSEQTAINNKYGNMYEVIGGVNIPYSGKLPDGSWIDVLMGKDWLKARIQEGVYNVFVKSAKIPYNAAGWILFENAIYAVLKNGVSNGLLVDDDFLSVSIPDIADISDADKANRHLPDVTFTAHLQGATNTIEITGTVSLP